MQHEDLRLLATHLEVKLREHRLLAEFGKDEYRAWYAAVVAAALETAARRWYPDGAGPDDIVGIVAGFRARAGILVNVSPRTAERVLDAAVNGRPWPPLDWLTAVQSAEFLLGQVVTEIGLTGDETRELLTAAAEKARPHPGAGDPGAPAGSADPRVTGQDVDALRACCSGTSPEIIINALRPGSGGHVTAVFVSAALTVAARRWIADDSDGKWDARSVIRLVADIRGSLARHAPFQQHALDPDTAESLLNDAFAGTLRFRHDQLVTLPAQILLLTVLCADLGHDAVDGILADARSFADLWLSRTILPGTASLAIPEDAHAPA